MSDDRINPESVNCFNDQNTVLCPKCGVLMLCSNGTYGLFYECTNLPTCHETLYLNRK